MCLSHSFLLMQIMVGDNTTSDDDRQVVINVYVNGEKYKGIGSDCLLPGWLCRTVPADQATMKLVWANFSTKISISDVNPLPVVRLISSELSFRYPKLVMQDDVEIANGDLPHRVGPCIVR